MFLSYKNYWSCNFRGFLQTACDKNRWGVLFSLVSFNCLIYGIIMATRNKTRNLYESCNVEKLIHLQLYWQGDSLWLIHLTARWFCSIDICVFFIQVWYMLVYWMSLKQCIFSTKLVTASLYFTQRTHWGLLIYRLCLLCNSAHSRLTPSVNYQA